MGQQYPNSTIGEKKNVPTLYIYGDRAISQLFCDHCDAESESCEIEMSISQPIFTHKNVSEDIWDNNILTLQDGGNYCVSSSYLSSFSHFPDIL